MSLSISNTDLYKLTNSYTGPDFPLALDNTSTPLGLRVSSTDPLLPWQFLAAVDATKYNICTKVTGQLLCLDIIGSTTVPHLTTPGYVTGQQWTLTAAGGQGGYKLSNDYSGAGLYLDVYSDTKIAFMDNGDDLGEHWTLTAISASASSSTTLAQTVSSPSSSTTPTSTPTSTSSPLLSPGAIAGIVTGSVSAMFAAMGFLLKLYKWKHPKKETTSTVR